MAVMEAVPCLIEGQAARTFVQRLGRILEVEHGAGIFPGTADRVGPHVHEKMEVVEMLVKAAQKK